MLPAKMTPLRTENAAYPEVELERLLAGEWASGTSTSPPLQVEQAKVALARKLAVILHRRWRDETAFDAAKASAA